MLGKTSVIGMIFIALLASGTAVAVAAATPDDEEVWRYSQERNPVSGGTIYRALAELPELQASVRCSTANPLVEVRFFLNRDALENFERVQWQFDGTRSRSDKWPRSANGRSLIVPNQSRDRFLNQLKAHNFLYMTIIATNGGETLFEIPLAGSSAAISRAMDRCR